MKNLFILSLSMFLLISVSSCKKEANESTLEGSWELRRVDGGNVAGLKSDYAAGNGNILKFSGANYERYVEGKVVDRGTFKIEREKQKINNSESNFTITYNRGEQLTFASAMSKEPINLSSKALVTFTGVIAADGFESHYVKL